MKNESPFSMETDNPKVQKLLDILKQLGDAFEEDFPKGQFLLAIEAENEEVETLSIIRTDKNHTNMISILGLMHVLRIRLEDMEVITYRERYRESLLSKSDFNEFMNKSSETPN